SADASTLFYLTVDETWRPYRVWRHRVGAPASADEMVYEESDQRFWVGVELTRSQRFVQIDVHSSVTSEVWLIPADDPAAPPRLVAPRRQGVQYHVEDDRTGGRLLILHNRQAEDFALAWTEVPAADGGTGEWKPLIEHTPGTRLEAVDAFAGHLVVSLRQDGLTGLRVLPIGAGDAAAFDVTFPEPIYRVELGSNPEYETATLRLEYSSLVTPES